MKFTLNGVYDYYPYGKILREYVKGSKEKHLATHHQLDKKRPRLAQCKIAMIGKAFTT
ncbi:MAG TPA: hypothetical protein PK736_03070 [Bacteroidia bacterium]|nr:hypothetical protein [Bacteroidia bacterium]